MHRMDAELHRDGKQDRRRNQHDRTRFHHVAGDQQQDVDEDQERDPVDALLQHPGRELLRNLFAGHQERE